MTEQEAYDIYAAEIARQRQDPKPYGSLNQSYLRNGVWFLRGYHSGTVAAVNTKTGEVN